MPDHHPTNHTAAVVPLPRWPEPLDPTDPGPEHVFVDLNDWDIQRLDAVFETLMRSDLDFAWTSQEQICFHDADKVAIDEVLDRFRDAPLDEVAEVLHRYWEEDFDDDEADEGY